MTLDPAFQLSFHNLTPEIKVAGEQVAYLKKFVKKGGRLAGESGIEVAINDESNYNFYETTKIVRDGGLPISSISSLYDNFVTAGLTELIPGLAVNVDAIAKLEIDDDEIKMDFKGKGGVLRFFKSAVSQAVETQLDRFEIPTDEYMALRISAMTFKNNLEERLDDLKAYIDTEDGQLDTRIIDALQLLDNEAVARQAGDTAQQTYTDTAIANLVDSAPAVLDTLREISESLGGDDDFATTMTNSLNTKANLSGAVFTGAIEAPVTQNIIPFYFASQSEFPSAMSSHGAVAHSHADGAMYFAHGGMWHKLAIDADVTAAIAALQSDVDQNESDADSAIAAETSARNTAITALDTALRSLISTLQADVDQNESDADSGIAAEQTARANGDSALSGRLDTLEADPTTQTLLTAETTARTAADTALSGRLDTLEADPTTATAVTAFADAAATARTNLQTALQAAIDAVQADVNTNESNADAAIALRAPLADPDFTGQLEVGTNARLEFDSNNLTKISNVLRGTDIEIGNNITLNPAAANGRVEIEGGLYLRPSDLVDAADDTAAAAAGVIVGQIYHNSGELRVRIA